MNETEFSLNCRVCLRTDPRIRKKYLSLFDKYNDYFISEIINSIADVKIQEGDGLPNAICPDCLSELDTVVNFKRKCESSNIILKTTFSSNQSLIETESSSIQQLQEIKKEDPEVLEECLEYEFIAEDCDYPYEDTENKTSIDTNVETTTNEDRITDAATKKSKAIDLKLQCNECGGFFKSKCKMSVHWKTVHMHESLICKLCKRTFKSYKAYNHHNKKKTIACTTASECHIEGIGKSRVFHCKKCSYSSRRVKDLHTHLVIHTGERPFVCDICSRGFSQQSSLQCHMETAHKIFRAETTCVFCGKHLKGRSQIYNHMRTHRSNWLQCDLCKKMLKTRNSLIVHLQRHTGVKSYTCDQCAKTFYVLSELCNHRRSIHEKGKLIFKCDICGYKAFSTTVLKRHKSKHTSTNLPCLECGMFLENSQKLAEHQRRHFGKKMFACPYCEKKYMNRKSLSLHLKKVHKSTFLINKPIKHETSESSCTSGNPYCVDNMIEVEVPP